MRLVSVSTGSQEKLSDLFRNIFVTTVLAALLLAFATPAAAVIVNVGGGIPTGMEIEDTPDGAANKITDDANTDGTGVSYDWVDILDGSHPGPYTHTQDIAGESHTFFSYGIVESVFDTDDTADGVGCVGGDEDGFGNGAKVSDNPFAITIGGTGTKADACSGAAALEIVRDVNNVTGEDQLHYILYNYWTRNFAATGEMTTYQILRGPTTYNPDTVGVPGDPEYRCDDFLIQFDYAPSNNTVVVSSLSWKPKNSGVPPYTNAECSGDGDWLLFDSDLDGTPGPDTGGGVGNFGLNTDSADTGSPTEANEGTFGEFGVDLTALGLLSEDGPCSVYTSEGFITRTGNSANGSTIDFMAYATPLQITNCTDVEISKVGNTPSLEDFEYVLYQEDGFTVHDAVNSLVETSGDGADTDASVNSITSLINIDEVHYWENVIAEPDYLLDETGLPADWELGTIVCTYYDPFGLETRVDQILPEQNDGAWDEAGGLADPDTFRIPPAQANNGIITSCEISNLTSGLVVEKTILNGDSGTATLDDFDVSVDLVEVAWTTPGSTTGGSEQVTALAGTYNLSENDLPDYTEGAWNCVDDLGADVLVDGAFGGADVTVATGRVVTCSITNAKQPSLTLVKEVDNGDGGTALVTDWTLTATGVLAGNVLSGAGGATGNVLVDTFTLSETTGPAGYTAGDWVCVGGTQNGASVALSAGQVATCTIINDDVAPTLTLVKTVTNDDGGLLTDADFPVFIDGGVATWGAATAVMANVQHTASETEQTGYAAGDWGGDCAADGTITLLPGDVKTCSITNDDVAPTLTLVKTVTNDNGGELTQADFPSFVDGNAQAWDVATAVTANAVHTASETPQTGYTPSAWGGDCAADGTITLLPGDVKTCSITNDDVAPTLTLVKTVTNDDGGLLTQADFPSFVDGNAQAWDVATAVTANAVHTASETPQTGYTPSAWGGDCAADGTITLLPGDVKTCSITNDDVAPTLTLVKTVTNDDGGLLTQADFPSFVDGNAQAWDVATAVTANVQHTASETPQTGYAPSAWGGDCAADGTITLLPGDVKTCSITNDDVAPTLTLVKTVTNDNGGELTQADFPSFVDGNAQAWDVATAVEANVQHTASETTQNGYLASIWAGDCAADGTITMLPGDVKTCTITNDDVAPTLTLVKDVTNDDGGDAVPASFVLRVDDGQVASPEYYDGDTPAVDANTAYTISEDGLDGYTETSIVCLDDDTAADLGNPVTLDVGQLATCTVYNDDDPPQLTVIKSVINDDGGSLGEADFTLHLAGDDGEQGTCGQDGTDDYASGAIPTPVFANCAYTMSEEPVPGYNVVGIECTDDVTAAIVGHPVTLNEGQFVTCIITNDDAPPGLTLIKSVTNDDGGTALAGEFTLRLTGGAYLGTEVFVSGDNPTVMSNTSYTLSEDAMPGYTETGIVCTDTTTQTEVPHPVMLAEGQMVACTISNDDDQPYLTLNKVVVNDDGGLAIDTDWTLTATGSSTISGSHGDLEITSAEVNASVFTLSESNGPTGYTQTSLVCVGNATPLSGNSLTIGLGEDVSCTFTNDDDAPSLTVVKTVTNDDGGNALPDDFMLTVGGTPVLSGASNTYLANTPLAIDETQLTGYTFVSITGHEKCPEVLGGSITLAEGDVITCTITNDDVAPKLTLIKDPTNDDGGNAAQDDFILTVDGGAVLSGVTNEYMANTPMAIDETQLTGYTFVSITGDQKCPQALGGMITLDEGDDITCTITNDDTAPKLTLIKTVINDNGGNALPDDFMLTVGGTAVVSGESNDYMANTPLAIDETELTGYTFVSITGDAKCPAVLGGTAMLDEGDDITCTITNDDVAPTLTLVKTVVNDDGGLLTSADFPAFIDEVAATWGAPVAVSANAQHTATETSQTGYIPGDWGGDCAADGTITLLPGDEKVCTITNDDVAPTLTLVKTVINDNGGTLTEADFPSFIDGVAQAWGTSKAVMANVQHRASETSQVGYTAGDWGGDCAIDGTVTLLPGDAKTCTITNDDVAPGLTLTKVVINDNGGQAVSGDWVLNAAGPVTIFGASGSAAVTNADVSAGSFTLTESDGPAGYLQTSLECTGNATPLADNVLTMALGEEVSCTFTNDDQAGAIMVDVITMPGGSLDLFDFTLSGGNVPTLQSSDSKSKINAVPVFQEFSVADTDPLYSSGYLLPTTDNGPYAVELVDFNSNWLEVSATCNDGSDPGAIDLGADEIVTCTFVFERRVTYVPVPVPMNASWALLLMILSMLLTAGWYLRTAGRRNF